MLIQKHQNPQVGQQSQPEVIGVYGAGWKVQNQRWVVPSFVIFDQIDFSFATQSKEVLDAVKKDLDELSTVVKEEASAASEALGLHQEDSTVGVMKKSISSFLGTVSDVLVPPVEEEEAEAIMITQDGMVSLTGFAKHLAELQANDKTYLQEPADELLSQYKRWLEVIEQDQFTEPRLTRQLTNSQILNEKYLSLVPAKVSHMEFWKRYLFKKGRCADLP